MLVHIQTVSKCKKEVVASFVIVFNVTLCFGNYNSVLRDALQKKDCESVWFDKEKRSGCLYLWNICVIIVNMPPFQKLEFIVYVVYSDLIAYLKEQLSSQS